jgi:hypothetical protein
MGAGVEVDPGVLGALGGGLTRSWRHSEALFSRRCTSEDEARYVANGLKQDELTTSPPKNRYSVSSAGNVEI